MGASIVSASSAARSATVTSPAARLRARERGQRSHHVLRRARQPRPFDALLTGGDGLRQAAQLPQRPHRSRHRQQQHQLAPRRHRHRRGAAQVLERALEPSERAYRPTPASTVPGRRRASSASSSRPKAAWARSVRAVADGSASAAAPIASRPERRRLEHVVAEHQRVGERVARVRPAGGEVACVHEVEPDRVVQADAMLATARPAGPRARREGGAGRPRRARARTPCWRRARSARGARPASAPRRARRAAWCARPPDRRTRSRPRPAPPGSPPAGRGARAPPAGSAAPPPGTARPSPGAGPCSSRAALTSSVDGAVVAELRRVLDVVRARDHAGAATLQGGGRAGMGGEPPAARRALVDGMADDRVAEREPPRRARRPHERARQQVVQRPQRVRLRDAGGLRRQARLERVADHGGAVEHEPRVWAELRKLGRNRQRHRGRGLTPIRAPTRGLTPVRCTERASCSR